HRRAMICAIGITAFNAAAFYLMLVYITTYLMTVVGQDAQVAFEINTANMAILVLLIPLWGWISDRVGIQKVLVVTVVIAVFATIPLFWLIDHKDPLFEFLGQFGMVMLLAPYLSCFATRMAFLFPTSVRMSAFSTTYNIGLAVFGGTAPLAASYLIERDVGEFSPAYLLTGAAVLSLVALLSAPRAVEAT
ncbi:MAG: MFS transporter, partial [Alphaproteobacteria bacterium]